MMIPLDTLLCAALWCAVVLSSRGRISKRQTGGGSKLSRIVSEVTDAAVITNLFDPRDINTLRSQAMDLETIAKEGGVERQPGCRDACKRDLLLAADTTAVPTNVRKKIMEVATALDPEAKVRMHLMFTWPRNRRNQDFHKDAPGRAHYWTLIVPLTDDSVEMGGTEICRTSSRQRGPEYRIGEISTVRGAPQSGLYRQRVKIDGGKDKTESSGIVVTALDARGYADVELGSGGKKRSVKFRDNDTWSFSESPCAKPKKGERVQVYWDGDDRLYVGSYDGRGAVDYDDGTHGPLIDGKWLKMPRTITSDDSEVVDGTDARVLQLASGKRYPHPQAPTRLPTKVPVWNYRDGAQKPAVSGRISEYLGMTLFKGNVQHRGLGNFSQSRTRVFLYAVLFRGDDPNE